MGCDSVLALGGDIHGKPYTDEAVRERWGIDLDRHLVPLADATGAIGAHVLVLPYLGPASLPPIDQSRYDFGFAEPSSLDQFGVRIRGHMTQIGEVQIPFEDWAQVDQNPFFAATADTRALLHTLRGLWPGMVPAGWAPMKVAMLLHDLRQPGQTSASLFADDVPGTEADSPAPSGDWSGRGICMTSITGTSRKLRMG